MEGSVDIFGSEDSRVTVFDSGIGTMDNMVLELEEFFSYMFFVAKKFSPNVPDIEKSLNGVGVDIADIPTVTEKVTNLAVRLDFCCLKAVALKGFFKELV